MKNHQYIGITYGDPAGVGPEIVNKTLKKWKKLKNVKLKIIGSKKFLKKFQFSKNHSNEIQFAESKKFNNVNFTPGKLTKNNGKHAYECLKYAVSLALKKEIKALVTGPVSKSVVSLSKKKFKGQTDEIAKLCGINPEDVIMSFMSNDFRIALFTRHVPLKDVSKYISKSTLKKYLLLLNSEIKKWLKIKNPKIAVLGLNPHAGEKGLIGYEEGKIIIPVIKDLTRMGLKLTGPLSPDATLAKAGRNYLQNQRQPYDIYVSFYHDQCLPLFKAVTGLKGLNVTLGLPFIRVSPDHGTGFDIAGKGKADFTGFLSAIKFASKT